MTKPYRNSGKNGELLFEPARFAELVIAADKQGLIVHVHALGDLAVKESLNGIERARRGNGNSGLPHTLTHVQFADPEDIPRFHELGVVAALQLLWASAGEDTIGLVKPYLEPDLYQWQYPARSLLDNSAIISGASDWPVSTANVFQAIYQAETRKGRSFAASYTISKALDTGSDYTSSGSGDEAYLDASQTEYPSPRWPRGNGV